MNDKLILTKVREQSGAFYLRGDRLISASLFPSAEKITGGIYVARVRDVVPDLNACFVEIQKDLVCFLPGAEMRTPCILTPGGASGKSKKDSRPLRQGDLVLVQGIREAQKTKQPTVTAHISLSNPYFALTIGPSRTGFSSKLTEKRKEELKSALRELPYFDGRGGLKPMNELQTIFKNAPFSFPGEVPGAGIIVRTQCGEACAQELTQALEHLLRTFLGLLETAFYRNAHTCLQSPPKPWQEALTNLVTPGEGAQILTDDAALFQELCADQEMSGKRKPTLYQDASYPLEKLYSLATKLNEALGPRIWLKSGAYLIIEPTEALTVIDVNSGKFEAHRGDREFIRAVNLEAAAEIARQIRLRNLSGMILVDFINMNDPQDQAELLQKMETAVSQDRVRTSVIDFTKLGLMEITRQRKDPPLLEQARAAGYR